MRSEKLRNSLIMITAFCYALFLVKPFSLSIVRSLNYSEGFIFLDMLCGFTCLIKLSCYFSSLHNTLLFILEDLYVFNYANEALRQIILKPLFFKLKIMFLINWHVVCFQYLNFSSIQFILSHIRYLIVWEQLRSTYTTVLFATLFSCCNKFDTKYTSVRIIQLIGLPYAMCCASHRYTPSTSLFKSLWVLNNLIGKELFPLWIKIDLNFDIPAV